jgi:hypothetical protein
MAQATILEITPATTPAVTVLETEQAAMEPVLETEQAAMEPVLETERAAMELVLETEPEMEPAVTRL